MSSLDAAAQFWSAWGLRIYVLSSLSAHVVLSLLSGTRRRSAAGWRALLLWFVALLLWVAYQVAEIAGTGALGNLSLCGSGASSPEEQQLIAFWAPFLLLHLGGPDTMTAYALEDNALSVRKLAEIIFHVLGAAYALYKYVYMYDGESSSWTLLAASAIVFVAGTVRYLEKWYALRRSNLGNNIKDDGGGGEEEEEEEEELEAEMLLLSSEPRQDQVPKIRLGEEEVVDDEEALRLAQDLFHVCRRAMINSSVVPDRKKQRASNKVFLLEWRSMCRVVEMELSLLYEALYTKSIVLHTRPVPAYLIRLLSPLATAAAAVLFSRYYYYDYGGVISRTSTSSSISGSFVVITYLLLGVALVMDVVWLLRALGSTWAGAALRGKARAQARRRQLAWWTISGVTLQSRLHSAVVALEEYHPVSWLLSSSSSFCSSSSSDDDNGGDNGIYGTPPPAVVRRTMSHRTWSGTIGRYNVLGECCAAATDRRGGCRQWCRWFWRWLEKKFGLEERPYLDHLPQEVKGLLMERVRLILASTTKSEPAGVVDDGTGRQPHYYTMAAIRTHWGHRAFVGARRMLLSQGNNKEHVYLPLFGREFEEDVLVSHIATCVFLSSDKVKGRIPAESSAQVKAIEAMSEHLMFLVAVRRQMLPGLVLHSLFEATFQALGEIWAEAEAEEAGNQTSSTGSSSSSSSLSSSPKDKLALKLHLLHKRRDKQEWFERDYGTRLVKDAATLAGILIQRSRNNKQEPQVVPQLLLDFIFNVWVDKLLYAAVRCSRESHAKQLSCGGDLTTVLWMIVQHASLYRMGERKPDYKETDDE